MSRESSVPVEHVGGKNGPCPRATRTHSLGMILMLLQFTVWQEEQTLNK